MKKLLRDNGTRFIWVFAFVLCAWLAGSWWIARAFSEARADRLIGGESARLERDANNLSREIADGLAQLHVMPAVLARDPALAIALARAGTLPQADVATRKAVWSATLPDLDRQFALTAKELGVDLLWLMNTRGDCIAASNADRPGSLVGTPLGDRAYFHDAIAGRRGYQYAVGRATNIPGLFFSAPVTAHGAIVGVVAVKIDIPRLSYWINQADAFVTDDNGVIVLARDQALNLHTLAGAAVERLSPAQRQARYKRSAFVPLALQPWGDARQPSLLRLGGDTLPLLLASRPLASEGISVFVRDRLDGLGEIERERLGLFFLLAAGGSILLLILGSSLTFGRIRAASSAATARSLSLLHATIDSTSDGILVVDLAGRISTCNEGFARLWSLPAPLRPGDSIQDFAALARELLLDPQRFVATLEEHRVHAAEVSHAALHFADGRIVEWDSYPQRLENEAVGTVWSFRDVTSRKRVESELKQSNEQLSLAIESAQISLWDLDFATQTISLDAHWARILGKPGGETSAALTDLARGAHPADLPRFMQSVVAALKGEVVIFQEDIRYKADDGRWKWIQCNGKVILRDAAGRALRAIGTNLDVTSRKDAEERIRRVAVRDLLTGLPNRLALAHHLPQAIARAQRNRSALAIGMIDLDDFKPVNDAWGHEAGDRLLQELARRLEAQLRAADFLARLGGDEFVIVIEDLDEIRVLAQLRGALERLHLAVETPFEIAPGQRSEIGMTAGVALYPTDASDPDALLRHADVAMYKAKQHKIDRTHWWSLSGSSADLELEPEAALDAFGAQAGMLLTKARPQIDAAVQRYLAMFYDLEQVGDSERAIFTSLSAAEIDAVKAAHTRFLCTILSGETTALANLQASARIGTVHALVGVSAPLLVQSVEMFRSFLSEQIHRDPMPARDRYRLLAIADTRLQAQLHAQLEVGVGVFGHYLDLLSQPLPAPGTRWADAVASEIANLGGLEGIQGVALLRLAPSGVFAVEAGAGPQSQSIREVLQKPGLEAVVDPHSPRGQGLTAQAWRSGQILSVPAYAQDARYGHWHERTSALPVRSTMSIPVRDAATKVVAVVSFYGAYPNQFESPSMRQFARGLQQRWDQIWARCATPAPVVQERQALALRERLFAGGLQMFVQPLVDLRSGRVLKLEALARLQLEDGQIIAPALFLPLLGDADLDHVFRIGLDRALEELVALDKLGHAIDLSVNLAPGTLLDPSCPLWVEETLRRHGIAPQRLTLELLEAEGLGSAAQDQAIARLTRLGVKLAMDDLGSGYSSLQRLSSLPFDSIKIDQSLTLNLRKAPLLSLPLIRALVQLGADLSRQVVVEGLEDRGMIEAALVLGAAHGQGYGLARPMPGAAFAQWLAGYAHPVAPGTLRTCLGALAHHWLDQQAGERRSALEPSPLKDFFDAPTRAGTPAAGWFARSSAGDAAATQRLTEWLIEQLPDETGML
jgi:diguanylate cyclase (GGDEF)-like protein